MPHPRLEVGPTQPTGTTRQFVGGRTGSSSSLGSRHLVDQFHDLTVLVGFPHPHGNHDEDGCALHPCAQGAVASGTTPNDDFRPAVACCDDLVGGRPASHVAHHARWLGQFR